jgi:hypothetical protein
LDLIIQQLAQRIKQSDPYTQILKLDNSIRFVGRIKDRKLVTFARNQSAAPLLDEELSNMVHYQASVKASWDEMFNEKLGKTNWMITSKERVKLITLFLDDGLLILSTEPESEHDVIIQKIKNLNVKL